MKNHASFSMLQRIAFILTMLVSALAVNRESSEADVSQRVLFRQCTVNYGKALNRVRLGFGDTYMTYPQSFAETGHKKHSPRKIVWGAGFGHTGTRSLIVMLESLGLRTWHYAPNQHRWSNSAMRLLENEEHDVDVCRSKVRKLTMALLPEDIDAFIDTPSANLFLSAYHDYPNALFILTDRPAEDWAKSRSKEMFAPVLEPCGLNQEDFNFEETVALLDAHRDLVKCVVPPDRLLLVNSFTANEQQAKRQISSLAEFVSVKVGIKDDFPVCAKKCSSPDGRGLGNGKFPLGKESAFMGNDYRHPPGFYRTHSGSSTLHTHAPIRAVEVNGGEIWARPDPCRGMSSRLAMRVENLRQRSKQVNKIMSKGGSLHWHEELGLLVADLAKVGCELTVE